MSTSEYQRNWGRHNPLRWKEIQAKFYSKHRTRILLGKRAEALGISEKEVAKLAQQKTCEISGDAFDGSGHGKQHIDHNHTTGEIRGVVTGRSNLGLSHFKDDPEVITNAAEYLIDRDASKKPIRISGSRIVVKCWQDA
jgi:hypothetical protein